MNLKVCHIIQGPKKHKDQKIDQTHWDYIQEHPTQGIQRHFQNRRRINKQSTTTNTINKNFTTIS
jgi:hypothetical protein